MNLGAQGLLALPCWIKLVIVGSSIVNLGGRQRCFLCLWDGAFLKLLLGTGTGPKAQGKDVQGVLGGLLG